MKFSQLFSNQQKTNHSEEKIRLSVEDFAAQNPYYAAIARGYHIAQLTLFSILACFVMLSMLIRADEITYENFFYLFKDIHAAVDSDEISFRSLVYDADEAQTFAAYRGGLAVAGESGLTIFTATGRQTLNQSLGMSAPQLLSSDRYILVYDQGGSEFALYNSFARIHHGNTSNTYSCAAISDSDWFALGEQDGNSALISVYDKNMTLKAEHIKKGYISSVALNREGDLLAIVMVNAANGSYQTSVSLYITGTDQLVQDWVFSDFFPLTCSFADSETILLSGSNQALVLNSNGTIGLELMFDTAVRRTFHSDEGFAFLMESGELFVYDKNGEPLVVQKDAENVLSVLIGSEMIYIMTNDTLRVYRMATDELSVIASYPYELQELLWYAEKELVICSRSTARYIHTED